MDFQLVKELIVNNWPMFLRGAGTTLFISLIGTLVGTVIGLLIGIVRTIPLPKEKGKAKLLKITNSLLSFYVEFFRGTPMMVQAMVVYYGVAQAFGVYLDKMLAALIIVSINTGAYMAEIVRGGITSIDKGQFEGAKALGMSHYDTMVNIVFPQVMRNILPATGNELVVNIKDTSVLNVISVTELFFQTKSIVGTTFKFFEPYFIVSIIYFFLTFTVTQILRLIERKLDGPESYVVVEKEKNIPINEPTFGSQMS